MESNIYYWVTKAHFCYIMILINAAYPYQLILDPLEYFSFTYPDLLLATFLF
jgi:hypothetical protein